MSQFITRSSATNSAISLTALAVLTSCVYTQKDSGDEATGLFRDCPECPLMITVPAGSFLMGTAAEDRLMDPRTGEPATNDGPQHTVVFAESFALGAYEVTVAEFEAFANETGYVTVDRCMEFSKVDSFDISTETSWQAIGFTQSPDHPVACISFFDAQAYAQWLSEKTGKNYRLPSEAEWEYGARAGSTTPYFWGAEEERSCDFSNVRSPGADSISTRQTESDRTDGFPCDDGYAHTSPAGEYLPNNFGLYDMQGNAWEWVADCNHNDYVGAPDNGSAWLKSAGTCRFGVIRGGSFINRVERSSTSVRAGRPRSGGATNMGFRIALGNQDTLPVNVSNAGWNPDGVTDGTPGSSLFAANCAACHISSNGFEGLYGKDKKSLIRAISKGGNNVMSMPAFADRLTASEIEQLAIFLREQNDWQ